MSMNGSHAVMAAAERSCVLRIVSAMPRCNEKTARRKRLRSRWVGARREHGAASISMPTAAEPLKRRPNGPSRERM